MLNFKEDVSFFERHLYNKPFRMTFLHIHEHHELYFLEHGKTKYFSGNSIYTLEAGDFIFLPKGTYHRTENPELPNLERVNINFDDEFIGEEFVPYLSELASNPHIRIQNSKAQDIRDLMDKIERESLFDMENSLCLQQLYLRELIILLLRYRVKDMPRANSSAYRLAQDAATYISENYKQDLSLEILAKKYSVSTGYFSKLFKKHTGTGVNEYINISRILAAKELFKTTEMSVTDIAFECGFNDSNYFSQVFKRSTGMTPKKYSIRSKE